MDFKRFLPKTKTARLLIATLLLTVGVYLAFPEKENLATVPFPFVFSLLAYFVYPHALFPVGAGFAIALFYGKMTSLPVFLPFALYALISAACAVVFAWCIKRIYRKKYLLLILALPVLAVAVLAPCFFVGTAASRNAAEEKVTAYLEEKYPDQEFLDFIVYYDCNKKGYSATALYEFRDNTLYSSLFIDESGVEDGFLKDFSAWMQEERKSELIAILKKGSNEIRADSEGMTEDPEEMVFRGSFGSSEERMYPYLCFSVTFREEKPTKEEFGEACREAVTLIREASFTFGEIEFCGLDAGRTALTCKITPETMPEDVSGLIRYQK